MAIVDALINAAAVWVLLKTIEVIPTAIHDIIVAITRWKNTHNAVDDQDDGPYYDTLRGKLEYLFSGTHFGDLRLLQKSKKWLLISTVVPIIVFTLELMSIVLGNETRNCEVSRDLNVVSAPSLELYGEGARQTNIDVQYEEFASAVLRRPCVTWISSNSGIDYYSSICAENSVLNTYRPFIRNFLPNRLWIGLMIAKHKLDLWFYFIPVIVRISEPSERDIIIGTLTLSSQVLVNRKHVLSRNVTAAGVISEKTRQEFQEDVRRFEDRANITRGEYYEDDLKFGFHWNTLRDFSLGASAVIHAILAQATRGSIKTAMEMSNANPDLLMTAIRQGIDISCQDDYVLPRTVSIIIIVTAMVMRSFLIAVPASLSSVEFALQIVHDTANSEESLLFFMDRKRVICRLERTKG